MPRCDLLHSGDRDQLGARLCDRPVSFNVEVVLAVAVVGEPEHLPAVVRAGAREKVITLERCLPRESEAPSLFEAYPEFYLLLLYSHSALSLPCAELVLNCPGIMAIIDPTREKLSGVVRRVSTNGR